MLSSVRNLLGEGGIPDALRDGVALEFLNSIVTAQANTLGFQDGFIAIAFVSAIAVVPVFLLTRRHRRPQ